MGENDIIINLNDNRGGILNLIERQHLYEVDLSAYYRENEKADNAPRLTYRYNLSGEQCACRGNLGHSIVEVCTNLKKVLNNCNVKDKGLIVILKSSIISDCSSDGIVDIDDLRSIKNRLSKDFKNVQIMFE